MQSICAYTCRYIMVIWIINFIPYQTGKLYSNILQDIKYIYIRSNIKNVCGSGYMMIKSKIGREGKTLFFNLIFHRKCVGIICLWVKQIHYKKYTNKIKKYNSKIPVEILSRHGSYFLNSNDCHKFADIRYKLKFRILNTMYNLPCIAFVCVWITSKIFCRSRVSSSSSSRTKLMNTIDTCLISDRYSKGWKSSICNQIPNILFCK